MKSLARIAIFISEDDRKTWRPISPALVPEKLRHPDVMCHIVEGGEVQLQGKPEWYKGVMGENSGMLYPDEVAKAMVDSSASPKH